MNYKVIQSPQKWRYYIGHMSIPITGLYCSNNISILYSVRDIITFTACLTVRDLEKFFTFDMTFKITGFICEYILADTLCFSTYDT